MAKLHKLHSQVTFSGRLSKKVLGKKTYDEMHPIGTAMVQASAPVPETPVVPMPDEEDLRRARRRSSASQMRRSGRSSTILSDSDQLGP